MKNKPISSYLNVDEFKQTAEKSLPRMVYDYYASGSDSQVTLSENENYYKNIKLMPRGMIDVSRIDLKTSVLGVDLSSPIMIAPTAMQCMAHPRGELETYTAAKNLGSHMTLSSIATTSVEELSEHANGNPGWFQLYVFKERSVTINLVKRAEKSGFKALVVTVDTPFLGRREADFRNDFSLPHGLLLKNFADLPLNKVQGGLNKYIGSMVDSSLTWTDITWLRTITKLPILVKGIMSPEDAHIAVQNGVDGIIVSNHGARQLDTCPSTIEVLPHIVRAVNGRVPVLVDGGVRRGTDVLKALALGAKAVMIGRPVLWGLATAGHEGIERVMTLLSEELRLAMAFTGVTTVSAINSSIIWNPSSASKL
ncbi:hypothetical protein SAMD00019534_067450 [Acytostelium subglobosum LB1]|uniref:hypothetical protein n=1 Tax=Acytostelium subglobosum LB1 TaxID=1410327 RepID=UPI00064511D8|nr:hypothetical protein SAMD00019534_067450 [Acytostelium subglobosum LB1]GAM23570.1 hypothetical protein SAMD00019534_067450 [Acytostelium subglobosum LB1]|eukprot:XP_012753311.1 hypothetical protein SAMD00019534_067450 [Acytostelium subglobosum LB1]